MTRKNKIERLYFNRCCIYLKPPESDFLSESINIDSSENKIRKKLVEFYNKSEVRYFNLKDINEITKNIKEHSPGRNYHTPGDVKDLVINHEDVFANNTDTTISPGICFNTGMYTIEIRKNNKTEVLKFNSEEEMNAYFTKIKVHNI